MTQTLHRKTNPAPASKREQNRIEGYVRHSGYTLEQAQHRVGKAALSGTTMMVAGVQIKFR